MVVLVEFKVQIALILDLLSDSKVTCEDKYTIKTKDQQTDKMQLLDIIFQPKGIKN
jgi:hypothetical protein